MTQQSGQGAASSDPRQPADRPAHEGVVLPADGSEPLLPGTAGRETTPAGGTPWGQPWGPETAGPPPGGRGGQWETQQPQAMPLPPEGAGAAYGTGASYGQDAPYGTDASYGTGASYGAYEGQGYSGQQGYAPQSPEQPQRPAQGDASYGGQRMPLPPLGQGGAPLPPVAAPGAPMPGVGGSDAEATQYIAPVPAAGADEGATQYIPPVGPGALPPEAPAADATQFLGRAQDPTPAAASDSEPTQYIAPVPGGSGPAGHGGPPEPGAAPYGIRPGAPGDRQPPAEFDSLFRTEPDAGAQGPASTQQMPRFESPAAAPAPAPAAAPAHGGGHGGRRSRTGSKVPLIAAIGVGIAVLGVGAGALLSSGGGDDAEADDSKPVSAPAPADERPSPTADPAKAQAVALDKLLADSNNSRDMVIAAVRNVGKCQNLSQSATDLRAAAKQRNGLVTRLAGLKVDKLPANDLLTSSLNRAWKASASADNHYAAWADQVAGKKGCRKGHARSTPQQGAGNRASGQATSAKEQAANHWNAIARKYGLTTREKSQL
ncbi:hypothetical protein [Streptomyces alboniger]|uniref:Uncharacterized protein n=1 Tax=Streptomyces alboniger TaxID=132473 RepID=A0A5J6HNE3_STRAD|nr:hypothetical protein [Streptomyces alboniger]QEV18677.1 hypothetical protein CP975_15305 [Streptomyces alboniger]